MILLAAFLLFSCKKNDLQEDQYNPASDYSAQITKWVESLSVHNPSNMPKLQAFKLGLEMNRLKVEGLDNGEKAVIVPLNSSFTSAHNAGKSLSNSFVAVLDKNGKIRRANIVQYLPDNSNSTQMPDGAINGILNTANVSSNGKFSFLSIVDDLTLEVSYRNGKLKSAGIVQQRQDPNGRGNQCYASYLITTYYDEDGLVQSETVDFLGVFCDHVQSDDPYTEEGGTTNTYEYAKSKTVTWNIMVAPDSSGQVVSVDILKAKKLSSGGFFNANPYHNSSVCNFCSSSNIYDVYSDTQVTPSYTASTATMAIKGTLQYRGRIYTADASNSWDYSTEFP